ncbi:VOC family protein [Henriciella marina]|uniref:VOC family protein n=1 Tax=Henriciella marina TaxID=453851 RepID=A0ABT4LRT4_9PROT|nr:VOC family protein [Henriciella marina]MCZ4297050.1 VOC family protein [Henriciella marina]
MPGAGLLTAIDHLVLLCGDIEVGTNAYSALLGREPDWRAASGGAATSLFRVDNTAIELMAPDGDAGAAPRLRELISGGASLTSLAFRTDDITEAHRLFTRRGLQPDAVQPGESTHLDTDARRHWQRFRCSDEAMAGIKTFVIQPEFDSLAAKVDESCVHCMDHVVINTPNPDRAAANYGARLGLDLRLDRTAEQWKTRFLFFRTGGLTLEIINGLDGASDPAANDHIWGLTWTVRDIEAAHARLARSGIETSDVRKGRKPRTQVFTVKDRTLRVPTLFIAHSRD